MPDVNFLTSDSKNEQGYIVLISVLIILALVVLIASSANLISISESRMGLQESQTWQAYYLAGACAEDTLMKLKDNLDYMGNETLTFGDDSCFIELVEGAGNNDRLVKVSGTVNNQIRKIKIEINQVRPGMEIKSWSEVPEF